MPEPRDLAEARRCLKRAEADWRSADGLAQLVSGLGLLEDVIGARDAGAAATARNVASTYAARIYERVRALVSTDAQLPEPDLEHFFKVVLAFDSIGVDLPPEAAGVKIEVVRRLIDRYYEGHPPERKQQAYEELAHITGRD
jgi:hypothetical protein